MRGLRWIGSGSLRGGVSVFLSYGALHKQRHQNKRKGQHRENPKAVEIVERCGLLLAQVFEFLPRQLLRRQGIPGQLEEELLALREKGIRRRIEGIEIFAETQGVELIAPLLEGLRQRHPDAAALVAQQAQQAHGGATQLDRRVKISRDIRRRETYRQTRDEDHSGPDSLPGADVQVQLG